LRKSNIILQASVRLLTLYFFPPELVEGTENTIMLVVSTGSTTGFKVNAATLWVWRLIIRPYISANIMLFYSRSAASAVYGEVKL
jgi:hypothetical protein